MLGDFTMRENSTPIEDRKPALEALLKDQPIRELAASLGCGEPTLRDIFDQLIRPGRDPRQDAPPPILRSDVLSLDDLSVGMVLKGTVRNVVDFGAFVDIGVKQDGLLHRSQIPHGTVLKVGDILSLEILKMLVDKEPEDPRISAESKIFMEKYPQAVELFSKSQPSAGGWR